MNQRFFTSDEHIGHNNVLKFCNRPFRDLDEMKSSLISRHNERVGRGGQVYHLGDFFWRTTSEAEAIEYFDCLNGQHYFVYGNHDEVIKNSKKLRDRFVWVKDIAKVSKTEDTPQIVLLHYSMRTWEGSHRGNWHLYGHSHNGLSASVPGVTKEESCLSMDVGVDTNNYYPWSMDEIAAVMNDKLGAIKIINEFMEGWDVKHEDSGI